MFKSNKESRYADTPVSPAVETSVVHSFREEVTLLGNRRICDEAPNSNPLGRLDADGVLPKTSEALLVIKGKSSKRRIKRKKKAEQDERKTKDRIFFLHMYSSKYIKVLVSLHDFYPAHVIANCLLLPLLHKWPLIDIHILSYIDFVICSAYSLSRAWQEW